MCFHQVTRNKFYSEDQKLYDRGYIRFKESGCLNNKLLFKINEFKIHLERKHPLFRNNIYCYKCPKFYSSTDSLWETFLIHDYEVHNGPPPYKCTECGKTYTRYTKFENHFCSRALPVDKKYSCEKCGKSFANLDSLKRHIKQCQNPTQDFQCQICDMKFKYKSNLDSHIVNKHSGNKSFICSKCRASFKNSSNLKRHQKIHSTKKESF